MRTASAPVNAKKAAKLKPSKHESPESKAPNVENETDELPRDSEFPESDPKLQAVCLI